MSDLGRALARTRRLRGMKQSHAADLLGVSQATISRWESGAQAPSEAARAALERLTAAPAAADTALRRLVESSAARTHLICDETHALLAASPGRAAQWRRDPAELAGRSLRPFASPEIAAMEEHLAEFGWPQALSFWTGPNTDAEVPIQPGLTLWEPIRLADGRWARLVTTVEAAPPHARSVAHIPMRPESSSAR